MSQNGRFYHTPNVLRLYSECTPNVFRMYSDCGMHGLLLETRRAHKVFAHTCSHKCARTRSLAHGVFGCMCGAATETARILEQVPWGVWEVLVGKAVAGFVFRLVRPHSIPRGN